VADQKVNFDFTSTGADALARDFRKTADNATLAGKGARLCADAIEKQRKAAATSVGATLALAKADDILKEAEDGLRDGALEAEFALKKEAEAEKKSAKAALESAAAHKKARDALKGLSGPGLLGPAVALLPAVGVAAGVATGAVIGLGGAVVAAGGALAAFGAVAKPVLSDALKASQAVNAAQNTYQATLKAGVPTAQAHATLQQANANAQLTYAAALKGGAKPAAALAAFHLALAKNQLAYNTATNAGTFNAKAYAAEQAAIGKAYAGLSPAQIALSKQLGAMASAWDDVKAKETPVVAGALVPWLKSVTDLTGNLAPIIAKIAPVIAYLGTKFDALIGSAAFKGFRDFIGSTGTASVSALGTTLIDFFQGFITLLPQFDPLIREAVGWISRIGPAFATWASSKKAADEIQSFLRWFSQNGPAVGTFLKNVGGALKALAPGLTAGGLLELQAMSNFLGFVAKLPPGLAKPLAQAAAAMLILQKTGVVSVGIKLVGLGAAGAGITGPAAAAGAAIAAGIILKIREDLQSGFKGIIRDIPGWFNFGGLGFIAQSAQGWADLIVSKIRHSLLSWEDDVRHHIANTWDGIRHDAAPIWDKIYSNTVGSAIRIGHNVETQFNSLRHSTANIFDGIRHDIGSTWNTVFSNTIGSLIRLGHNVETQFNSVKDWLHQNFITPVANLFTITLPNAFRTAVTIITGAWRAVANAVRSPVNWVIINVIDRLISAFDWVSSKVGGPNISQVPGLPKFAAGGKITQGTGPAADNVLIRASRNETVVSAAHSRVLAPAFAALGVPGYAAGGRVGQNPPVNLHTGAGAVGGPALGPLGSVLGKIGDLGKILAAVVTGKSTAATNAFRDLLGGGTGGAAPALAGMLTAMPGKLLSAAVKKLLSFGGSSNAIVADALRWVGKIPYVWGGTAVPGGADCSGFVQTIYGRHGIAAPRTSEAQGAWVKRSGAVPGGLAFYNSPAGGAPPGHVAIIKDGSMVISQGGGMGPQLMPLTGALPLMFTGVPPGGFGKAAGGATGGVMSPGQISGLWTSLGGASRAAGNMARIAFAESGDDPSAVQQGQPPGLTGYGLYQITPTSGISQGGLYGNLLNASNNTRAAIALYRSGGYLPWASDPVASQLIASGIRFDQGGWLPPGVSVAVNNTGRPEQVIPSGRGRGGGVTLVLENRGVIGSRLELENWLVRAVDSARRKGRI
jgi:hypothetical protein